MTSISKATLTGSGILAAAILAGLYTSVIKWAGPNPSIEFFQKTDLSRILGPAFLAPIGFPFAFPPLFILPVGIFFILLAGYRRRRWPVVLIGFISLSAYWYGMVELAWNFD